MMIDSTVEYLAANNESRLLTGIGAGQTPPIGKRGSQITNKNVNVTKKVGQPVLTTKTFNNLSLETSMLSSPSSSTTSASSVESTGKVVVLPHDVDLKKVYANLNEIDERLNGPLVLEHFFADDFWLETSALQSNVGGVSNKMTASSNAANVNAINTISPKQHQQQQQTGISKTTSTTRTIQDTIEWHEGMNEWQPSHPYPSFRSYLNSVTKRRVPNRTATIGEFDEPTGFFLPPQPPQQLARVTKQLQTQQHHHQQQQTIVDKDQITNSQAKNASASQQPLPIGNQQSRYQSQSQSLNLLNNQIASQRLFRELNKLASNTASNVAYGKADSSPLLIKIDGGAATTTVATTNNSNSQQHQKPIPKTNQSSLLLVTAATATNNATIRIGSDNLTGLIGSAAITEQSKSQPQPQPQTLLQPKPQSNATTNNTNNSNTLKKTQSWSSNMNQTPPANSSRLQIVTESSRSFRGRSNSTNVAGDLIVQQPSASSSSSSSSTSYSSTSQNQDQLQQNREFFVNIKEPCYIIPLESDLNSSSKIFKVQTEPTIVSGQKSQQEPKLKPNMSEFRSESLLIQPSTNGLSDTTNSSKSNSSNNQFFFINNSFTFNNGSSIRNKASSTSSGATTITTKVIKPNLFLAKQQLMQAKSHNNINNATLAEVMYQADSNSQLSLPPILAGKRINLPLGSHRRRRRKFASSKRLECLGTSFRLSNPRNSAQIVDSTNRASLIRRANTDFIVINKKCC